MTAKRNFKRRVRQRQARTGESYVTARRHVLARRPEAPGAGEPPPDAAGTPPEAVGAVPPEGAPGDVPGEGPADAPGDAIGAASAAEPDRRAPSIPVVELVDVSDEARRLGLACRIVMFPSLAERIEPARVLGRLRELLGATIGDPMMAPLAGLALAGQAPRSRQLRSVDFEGLRRFLQRARAGLGGTFGDGTMLAFHVAERDGMVPILCTLAVRDTAIGLSAIDDMTLERWDPIERQARGLAERRLQGGFPEALATALVAPRGPTLFLIHEGQRHAVTRDPFVIGRSRATADLAIAGGAVAREHAAVIRRDGVYYLKDLGSTHGILYKGMRIDGKRIEEGDVFQIGEHEIRCTYLADGR